MTLSWLKIRSDKVSEDKNIKKIKQTKTVFGMM